MATLTLTLADAAALRTLFEDHLSKRRAFVPGATGVEERSACELVLDVDGRTHRLMAEVVHVRVDEPGSGAGLQLVRLDERGQAALRAFVELVAEPAPAERPSPEALGEGETEADGPRAQNLQERIGSLSDKEQQKLAATGMLAERVALERMYGPTVWETLLRNVRLTPPEVARIARKGTLTRPLVELIAANAAWLMVGEVQRALLSNPRSSSVVIHKVLRVMSRADLQLVPQQSAYPASVRQQAKILLAGKG